jgi:phage protein D
VPDADTKRATATNFKAKIAGTDIPADETIRVNVDLDLNQPAMAVLTLMNKGHRHSTTHAQGDAVEVQVGDGGTAIFKGEIVGIEPIYEAGGESKVLIRAFDRMHRLLRGRKSRTFQDQSDNDIVGKICGDHGLQADCGSDVNITYKHVYQHAQTDMEFLRTRAARIGYAVWVEDTKLHFKKLKTDEDSGIEFKMSSNPNEGHRMKRFAPRMSSAGVVKKVTVRAWDPEKKAEIVGEANAKSSRLGQTNAASAANTFGETKTFIVDQPVASVEQAKAIAEAKLDELSMGYVTGEAECIGNPAYKAGIVVKITVNDEKADDMFNGKYMVIGASHVYSPGGAGAGAGGGGYNCILKVSRDAQKGQ